MSVATKDSMNKYGLLGHTNNQMTILLNRIERQLGLSVLPLPDGLKKDDWAGIIMEDTLPVFSMYIPYSITTVIYPEDTDEQGWSYIDKHLPEGTRILGVCDLDFGAYTADQRIEKFGVVRYAMDYLNYNNAISDIGIQVGGSDMLSLFSAGLMVYLEWDRQNRVRLSSISGNTISKFRPYPLKIFIEHPSLETISPTVMDPFFRLARCDVANTIYQVLKFHDGLDTAYGNLDLKLDTLQQAAGEREDILRELKEANLSVSNERSPIMLTV